MSLSLDFEQTMSASASRSSSCVDDEVGDCFKNSTKRKHPYPSAGSPEASPVAKAQAHVGSSPGPFRAALASRILPVMLEATPLPSQTNRLRDWGSVVLPRGVVLVRGFLSLAEQIDIIRASDELHRTTPFYVKQYMGGSMHLFTLSMGMHWSKDPARAGTGQYSLIRSDFDKLPAQPIPDLFNVLSGRAFSDATRPVMDAVQAGDLPFCPVFSSGILNFYPHPTIMYATPRSSSQHARSPRQSRAL